MAQKREVSLEQAFDLAMTHMRQGNHRVAELVLGDILKACPDHAESLYMLGLVHYNMGDLDKALKTFKKAVKSENAEAEWWCNYAIILNEAGKHRESEKAYDKALEMDENFAPACWNKSYMLWLRGRYEEAEEIGRKAAALAPDTPEAWLNLGAAIVKQGRLGEAAECWEKALEIKPDFAFAWSNLGNVLRDMGHLEDSEEKCRKALECDPNYVQAMNNLGNALLDQGHTEEAEEQYRKAVAIKPDYAEAHSNLAISLIRQSRYEEAILHGRYAISFQPDYLDALINLGNAYAALGHTDEAEKTIQRAVRLKPDSAEAHIDLADILFMKDRYGDAEIELNRAQKLTPDSPRIHLKLSNVLERGNKIDEALKAIDKAVELNPEMPEAWLRKGSICHIANRIEDAREHFSKALAMNEDMPLALISMAELDLSLGNIDAARERIEKAQKFAPNNPSLYHTISKYKTFTEDDPDFQQMVRLEKDVERFGLDHASVLNFALFSAYENIGDYDKAFAHLAKGNACKRKLIPYDRTQQAENFKALQASYSREALDSLKGKGFQSELPVFIVGMPRSGTTLTEQIISAHPDAFGAGELLEISQTDTEFGPLNAETAHKMGKWYVGQVKKRDPSGKAKRITDKMPGNFSNTGKIAIILPDSRIIHCRRDPVDTCLSCFKQNFARGQYWSYDLAELADYYNRYLDLMDYWRDVLPDRLMEIDYEETVNNFEPQARALVGHAGLDWNDSCLKPHKQKRAVLTASKMQVIKPVYKTSVKSWQRYEKQLAPLIDGLKAGKAKDLL